MGHASFTQKGQIPNMEEGDPRRQQGKLGIFTASSVKIKLMIIVECSTLESVKVRGLFP